MKPVDMRFPDHPGRSDSVRACTAAILELDYTRVPDFSAAGSHWHRSWANWLGKWPLPYQSVLTVSPTLFGGRGVSFPDCVYLAVGPTRRNRGDEHMVVFNGMDMIHDPHPGRMGLDSVVSVFFLIPRRLQP